MAQQGAPREDYLLFGVAGLRCAIRREDVRELLPVPHLFRPPTAPPLVAGFFSLGGHATPALDAAALFGLEPDSTAVSVYRHLLLLRAGFALLVDRALDVVSTPANAVAPIADGETLNGCVVGVIEHDGGLVHVVAIDRLLLTRERMRLSALLDAAAARIAEWSPEP